MAPAAPRLIDRGDLLAALDRAAAKKVTIISAPAGSGKTSLLRAWAGRPGQPRRLAVVQVQRGQHDDQQFWLALLDAIRHATGADSGGEPPPATPDFNAPAMADRVLSELADARGPITLVIDDLHELTSPEALAQLTRLLTNLPPRVHAILTTRHDLRLGLHHLRLADELAEIRAADLTFSERETRELLDASDIALSEAGVALLHQRTEGWAAGLRLAAISLAGHPDPERFVTEFSGTDHTGPDIRLLLHQTAGMLHAGRGRHQEALEEFGLAEHLASQLEGSQALASQMTGWLLASQARLGMTGEARARLATLDDERASSGEIRTARAAICLADGDPAGALDALHDVLDGTAPVLGYVTVVEAHLLAGLAHRELGDQRAASQAAERALALAESDRVILPFAMTGSAVLLEALPRHQTAHAALLADILDVLHGSAPAARQQSPLPPAEELSPGELRVLRYLPTNLSRPEIAGQLSVSPNTVNAHIRSIYAKLGVRDRSSAVRRARDLRLLAPGRTR